MCAAADRPVAPDDPSAPAGPAAGDTIGFEVLGRDECLSLLRHGYLGRLAVVADGGADVFPVNYVVDGDHLVFRTAAGTKLDAACRTTPVAFEVDGSDAMYHGGWSVVVHGRGEEVLRSDERERLSALPLRPWADGSRDHWVRLPLDHVTGRRVIRRYDDDESLEDDGSPEDDRSPEDDHGQCGAGADAG